MSQLSVTQILNASSVTIANPNKSVFKELGVDAFLLLTSPQLFIAKKTYDWIKDKLNANKEKEREYQEIIKKQLKTRLAISKESNDSFADELIHIIRI